MTYNVFGGTLNIAQLNSTHAYCIIVCRRTQRAAQMELGSIFAACCVALPSVAR